MFGGSFSKRTSFEGGVQVRDTNCGGGGSKKYCDVLDG